MVVWVGFAILGCRAPSGEVAPPAAAPGPEGAPVAAPVPEVPSAPVPEDPGACPDGVVALERWQGEYPGPVVHVTAPIEVPSRVSPCAPQATATCRLTPGLYHPWGDGEAFVTVRGVDRYRVLKEIRLDGPSGPVSVPEGAEVAVFGEVGEGFCLYRSGEQELTGHCPGLFEAGTLDDLPDPDVGVRQFFRGACGTWVLVDDALFANDAVTEGRTLSFGEVGPAAP